MKQAVRKEGGNASVGEKWKKGVTEVSPLVAAERQTETTWKPLDDIDSCPVL